DDDRLVGLFWADEEAIRNSATFGDIVSFCDNPSISGQYFILEY
ncbi:hypothetical protein Tco_1046584, partial [Tanacetum coccineum]